MHELPWSNFIAEQQATRDNDNFQSEKLKIKKVCQSKSEKNSKFPSSKHSDCLPFKVAHKSQMRAEVYGKRRKEMFFPQFNLFVFKIISVFVHYT